MTVALPEASLCRDLDSGLAKIIAMPGAYHFGGSYNAVAEVILKELAAEKVP